MNVLTKILNLISPRDAERVISEEKDVPQHQEDNIADLRNNLLNAIIRYFKPYYGKRSFSDFIVIWISNEKPLLQAEVRDNTFIADLRTEFQNQQYDALVDASIIFETGNPLQDAGFVEITDGVFIELRPQKEKKIEIPTTAKISAVNGMGSLLKNEILLDSGKQKTYNIGRSEVVRENGIHVNHIVIRDDDPSQSQHNDCVSRTHAKIVFKDSIGFCLQVFAKGCRPLGGSVTKVLRSENSEELRDINTLYPLCDGDFIELGKAVLLKFEVEN